MAQTKLPSSQLNLSKTVDANGWTVYDYGTFKKYRKRYTNGSWAFGVGETDVTLQTWAMPVGVTLTTPDLYVIPGGNIWAISSWNGLIRAVSATVSGSNVVLKLHFANGSGATNNWGIDYIVEAVI